MSIAFTKIAYCTKLLLDFRADCPIPFAKFCFPGFSGAGFPFRWAVFSDSRPCRLRTVSGDTPSIPGGTQRPDDFRPAVRIGRRPCRLRTVSGDTPSIPGGTQRPDDFGPAVCALAVGPADCALSAATRHRYRAVPKGLTISGQPWALAIGLADCALSAATGRRYRAVPKGLTISGQPCAHWQRHLAARRLPAFAGGLRWQFGQ